MAKVKKNHHLRKIGDVWYFETMVKGKRTKKAIGESVTEARRLRDSYLKEILLYGSIQEPSPVEENGPVYGELAKQWVEIKGKEIRSSTLIDYRSAMNCHVLPKIGNFPIKEIGYLEIQKLVSEMSCSGKRLRNVLIPMREVFKFAQLAGIIEKNPMDLIKSPKARKPEINPLSMEEVKRFLEHVCPEYKNFFTVAFFTGMRFGEMCVLKWRNVDFAHGVIRVRETRVHGEELPPKTPSSVRDVNMLAPVIEALREQRKSTMGKSEYVFLNQHGQPLSVKWVHSYIWCPALKAAELKRRRLYETRHTFATLMLDAGELPGWVQRMMGHETLQMIHERYYSYIKNYQRADGSAFMEKVYNSCTGPNESAQGEKSTVKKFAPNLHQEEKRESAEDANSLKELRKAKMKMAERSGFEPEVEVYPLHSLSRREQ
jgi:integrase